MSVLLSDLLTTIRVYPAGADQKVPFEWRVPIAQYDIVKADLNFDGTVVKENDKKGLPLVFIFIGLILLPSLADLTTHQSDACLLTT